MTAAKKPQKTMPKGGRKGGATFPRMNLETAVAYARRLVSKTHTGPQPKDIIYSGVLDAKGSGGNVKISAVRQYGFLVGDNENGFSASEPAKQLAAAPTEELGPHYRTAALRPKIFKLLFDTYHGDAVTLAKLKQRAATLNVHPEETESCVEIYLQSAQLAGLVLLEGDAYRHVSSSGVGSSVQNPEHEHEEPTDESNVANAKIENGNPDEMGTKQGSTQTESKASNGRTTGNSGDRPQAIFNVNITLDSSLDIDKLQKHLELLRKYGAI